MAKFHGILEDVLCSKERIRVLRMLTKYPKEYTSRELSRYCGVSAPAVISILNLFEQHGFIMKRRAGRSILWSLDKDNKIYCLIIEPLFKTEELPKAILEKEIKTIARKHNVKKAILFGSIAQGKETPSSDIDVFFLVNKKSKSLEEAIDELRLSFLKKFGNALSTIVYTDKEYAGMNVGLKRELENAKILWG